MLNIDFKFLEFCTKYSSEGDCNVNLGKHACFGRIFDGERHQKNLYKLHVYYRGHLQNNDNNCLLDEEQIKQYINEINKFFKFEYTLKNSKTGFTLVFTIDAPIVYHKIVLSWLRYLYEFPYNVTLYELFKVKEEKGFKRLTILNLFNLIGSTMNCTKHGTFIHSIGVFSHWKKLITYKDFKKRIEQERGRRAHCPINSIIPIIEDDKDFKVLELPIEKRINHTNYWEDEQEYKKRLRLYRKNLKTLKNI